MPEFFNIILISLSRLLFSSPAFAKIMEEHSLAGARQVAGEMCRSPSPGVIDTFRVELEVNVLNADSDVSVQSS